MKKQLDAIADQVTALLKKSTHDIVEVGRLLAEARQMIPHGGWLTWLDSHGFSKSSAHNYVNAYKFAKKFPTVGNLNIAPGAIYELAKVGFNNATARKKVFNEARSRWIDRDDVSKILRELKPEPPPRPDPDLEPGTEPEPDQDHPRPVPPPPPTPVPAPSPRDTSLQQKFSDTVFELESLAARPSAMFAGLVPGDRLELIANFLRQIAAASKKAA